MAECFVRADLSTGELAQLKGAGELLHWARLVAEKAPPQDVYRDREGRKTLRIQYAGVSYFLKLHSGVGWREIFKNLLQGRLPVLGAANEYHAVAALRRRGVDTLSVAAYACRGRNPAALQSMLVTDELLATVSLEDFCADWATAPPPFSVRLALTAKLADTARRMHAAGINHRDFYLCHFHLDQSSLAQASPRCYLIDLHRAQLRRRTPRRWRIKDLAGLYFSAMDCGLCQRDLLRFMRHYSPGGLRQALVQDAALWRQVARRAGRLYRKGLPPAEPVGGDAGVNTSVRIIRGDSWARCLQSALAKPPADTGSWLQEHTQLRKCDVASRVGLLRLQGELCCLKFYPHKSAAQRWRFRLGRGRAVHSFDVASRLAAAQLPVPQPRACLLVPGGMLLLTRGIPEAIDLQALWQSSPAVDQARQMLIDTGTLLARLHRAGFAHGDCKWRNLLWSGGQFWLVDLDAVSTARPGSAKQARDLARFTLNAEELGLAAGTYELFLESYLRGVGESREQAISRMMPALRKLRARHLARYGERGQRLL